MSDTEETNLILTVRVVPRASKSEIVGEVNGALKVKIAAPPVDGAANAELIRLFSRKIGVSKSRIEILSGQSSPLKRVKIGGITPTDFQRCWLRDKQSKTAK